MIYDIHDSETGNRLYSIESESYERAESYMNYMNELDFGANGGTMRKTNLYGGDFVNAEPSETIGNPEYKVVCTETGYRSTNLNRVEAINHSKTLSKIGEDIYDIVNLSGDVVATFYPDSYLNY